MKGIREELDLSNKNLSIIPIDLIKKCEGLKRLKLNNNQIHKIPEMTFNGLHQLTIIELNNKKLSRIPDEVFKDCEILVVLCLRKNEINEITEITDYLRWPASTD